MVFSFWTYTLDLIESLLLHYTSIPYARIDGNLSGSRREQAIQQFQTKDSVRVILVSITCGGTGYVVHTPQDQHWRCSALGGLEVYADKVPASLDLTAASRAYLLEPQWNPMIEEQALSRIHRLGQTKEVSTIRYRVRNSFEEVSDACSPRNSTPKACRVTVAACPIETLIVR